MLVIYDHKGNANKNHTKIHLTPVRIVSSKTPPTSAGKDVGGKESSYTVGGNAS
jgi:hypothetical protein